MKVGERDKDCSADFPVCAASPLFIPPAPDGLLSAACAGVNVIAHSVGMAGAT